MIVPLLYARNSGTLHQLGRNARSLRPLSPVEFVRCVISANIGTMRENAALLAMVDTILKHAVGAREVVYLDGVRQSCTRDRHEEQVTRAYRTISRPLGRILW